MGGDLQDEDGGGPGILPKLLTDVNSRDVWELDVQDNEGGVLAPGEFQRL